MAGAKRDANWLKNELSLVLGWDDMILDALVDMAVKARAPGGDREELDALVQNFMGDSAAGVALVEEFLAATPPSSGAAKAPSATPAAASQPPSGITGSAAGGGGGGSGGKSYAASATAAPSASGMSQPSRTPQQQQQRSHQQQQQQQQQQGRGQAAKGGASSGWQSLGTTQAAAAPPPAAAAAASNSAAASSVVGDDGGDDFSRFVVDDRGSGGRGGKGSSKPGSSKDLQALEAGAAGAEKPGTADGGKVLGMFKAGGRIKAPAAKPVGMRTPDGGALAVAASLERKVINCLGCGKIYDCRSVTNDILRFLERGGVCTFCGDTVPLTYKDRQKAAMAATEAAEGGAGADSSGAAAGGGVAPEDAAAAAARAFKDRLVEYDRNAAKRTTVIDDQSDFFEIDTNAWLTDQERDELRRRRQMEEEAAAARKKRLTVTIDLIGRKVVLDEDVRKAEAAAAAAAAEREAAARKAAAAAAALRNTDGDGCGGGGGSAYGDGVAFSGNALSGMADSGPTKEQLAAALDSLRRMKASLNPAVAATAAPLFLPSTSAGAAGGAGGPKLSTSSSSSSATAAAAGSSGKAAAGPAGSAAAAGAAAGAMSRRHGPAGAVPQAAGRAGGKQGTAKGRSTAARRERVQHDLGAEFGFDAFGAEVALDDLMGGALLDEREQDGPYDICPPDLAPSTSYASRAANSHASGRAATKPSSAPDLPPGVVLLKGFLTLDEQVRIVRQIRELGTGPGGFYVPSYSSGGRLALRMMCLGLHWEPRTSKYEQTRSSYDGATPPPIPAGLVELCGRALAAASQASVAAGGGRFPPLQPDICLANFYERSGRLGMHQDKDELPDSLRAGLPVVSLSIGDSADFMYGRTRDVEQASSVRLDSGDLLVFGGPSRMIFHSVAKIHPNSAPPELIRATGMRPGRLNLTFRQYRASG